MFVASVLAGGAAAVVVARAGVANRGRAAWLAHEGQVENLSSSEPRGAGVRGVREGRVGFA